MIGVLLSVGAHPVSGRPRANPACARALELAFRTREEVTALHVGDPSSPGLAAYLGMGLERLTVLDPGTPGADAVEPLAAVLDARPPRLLLCGSMAETGEGSGMLPYLLAARLGLPVLAGVIGLGARGGGTHVATQVLSARLRRRVAITAPAVLIADHAAPAPRPFAYGRARAGRIETIPVAAPRDEAAATWEWSPARKRPPPLRPGSAAGAPAGAAVSMAGGGALTGLGAEEAARRIRDFLRANGLIGKGA